LDLEKVWEDPFFIRTSIDPFFPFHPELTEDTWVHEMFLEL